MIRFLDIKNTYLSQIHAQHFGHVCGHFCHERKEAPVLATMCYHSRPERKAASYLFVWSWIFLKVFSLFMINFIRVLFNKCIRSLGKPYVVAAYIK